MGLRTRVGRSRRVGLLLAPIVLEESTRFGFRWFSARFGRRRGYFIGFLLYWAGWCGMVPLGVLGRERLGGPFRLVRPTKTEVALLAIPPVIGFTVAFPSAVREADRCIVLTSAAIAGVNAAFEEVLWRGTYQAAFPEDSLLNTCYPTLGFAAWHYAPQAVFPNPRPGGAHSLVAVAALWDCSGRRLPGGSNRFSGQLSRMDSSTSPALVAASISIAVSCNGFVALGRGLRPC